ncbi:hypothetical protein UPYG_G00150140 [Umbra pygmaea]|uniref:NAC-A/B domain-containing protein n=1 Tax=Umbra pygmaea TaxID=75934 RepID=A0ABD0XHF3_UMBPY
MPGESSPSTFSKERYPERGAEQTGLPPSDMNRHASSDSTPSDSASSPSDSGSNPSPSTPEKLLPSCTSPFGPRLIRVTPSSSTTPRPQPEGSDHRHGNTVRLSGKFGGHGPCGRRSGPVKMERIKVLMGSEVESDYKQPEHMESRVVMGQETLLKSKETLVEKNLSRQSSQVIALPDSPVLDVPKPSSEPQGNSGEKAQLDTGQEISPQTPKMEQEPEQETSPALPFSSLLTPLLSPLTPASRASTEPVIRDVSLTGTLTPQEAELSPYGEMPYICTLYTLPSMCEPICPPAVLSFTEPSYAVDPLKVGVPSSLDPDLYYTAPSTPIKLSARPAHLKHHSYPGSPASPLSPNSPSDSEELCSPVTSPSGSYVTAEGSWASYTSSTSPCTSPNLLLPEEAQEAPACFVSSLSEIGDEVGEDRATGGERGEDRGGGAAEWRFRLYKGLAETVILEEEEVQRGEVRGRSSEEVKVSRGSCRPRWVTEDTSPLRSSSGRSTDSQEEGGESESSLCPTEEALAESQQYSGLLSQKGLELELQACVPEELYAPITSSVDGADSPRLTFTPDMGNLSPHTSSINPGSPNLTRDACSPEVSDVDNSSPYGDMGPFLLFPCSYSDDGEMEEMDRMIPASLLNFPLHTSLLFQADSMEITLFPREEEGNEGEEGSYRNEENDVDAYAAGEEEGDVEDGDDDEDEEEEVEDKVEREAKVEIAIEEEVDEDDDEDEEEEGEGKAVDDLPEEDTSASFLHSLSETSINEGLDESFCFHDDTDDSLDSASYNGEEDEHLYSTERHAEPPTEPQTETPGEPTREPPTRLPTEPPTKLHPETPTEPHPEIPTEPPTEPHPEIPREPPSKPYLEILTEPHSEVPTEPPIKLHPEIPTKLHPEIPTEPHPEIPTEPPTKLHPEIPTEPHPEIPTEPPTKLHLVISTEPHPEIPTEPQPEIPTEPPTKPHPETPTKPHPEKPTEPHPEIPTERSTEPHPEIPTEPPTKLHPETPTVPPTEPHPKLPTEPHHEIPTEPHPEIPTEPHPEKPTEPHPEKPTEPHPETPTEPHSETPTEPHPEIPTEPHPETSTEPPTETSTEPPTKLGKEPPTKHPTEPLAEPPQPETRPESQRTETHAELSQSQNRSRLNNLPHPKVSQPDHPPDPQPLQAAPNRPALSICSELLNSGSESEMEISSESESSDPPVPTVSQDSTSVYPLDSNPAITTTTITTLATDSSPETKHTTVPTPTPNTAIVVVANTNFPAAPNTFHATASTPKPPPATSSTPIADPTVTTQETVSHSKPVTLATQPSRNSPVTLATAAEPGKAATEQLEPGTESRDGKQSTETSEKGHTEQTDRDSFKLLIKPCSSQSDATRATQQTYKPCKPLPRVFGVATASVWSKPLLVSELELDQKNGNSSAEEGAESRLFLEGTTATNDLNKGVPLLLCPKEPNPNQSNIPVSSCFDGSPDIADNLTLTTDLCPCDPAQENLRENALSTDDGVPGPLGFSHTPLAVSPKRENSETDSGSRRGAGGGAWGAGEALSLSLGQGCALEAESLLLCEMEGQRVGHTIGQILSGTPNVAIDEDEVGVMGDEDDDNNSLCGRPDKMADVELVGGVPESNLSSWRSIEEISEAGGGEDGSSRFPEDDVSNLQSQADKKEEQETNESVFLSGAMPTSVTLNALSEEMRHQNVSLSASLSNIPLTEVGPQVTAATDRPTTSVDSSTQHLGTTKAFHFTESPDSLSPTGSEHNTSSDQILDSLEAAISRPNRSTDHKPAVKQPDPALSLLGGTFGSFSPKIRPSKLKSGRISQQSYTLEGKKTAEMSQEYTLSVSESEVEHVKKLYSQNLPGKTELQLVRQTEDADSQTTHQLKKNAALEGCKSIVYNSGERDPKERPEKRVSPERDREPAPRYSPEGQLSTEKAISPSQRGRKGNGRKQSRETQSQLSKQALSNSGSTDEPQEQALPAQTPADTSPPGRNKMKNKRGKKAAADTRQKTPFKDKPEAESERREQNKNASSDPTLSSQNNLSSTTVLVSKEVNQEVNQEVNLEVNQESNLEVNLEVLDNRPLPGCQTESRKDINDNNLASGQTSLTEQNPSSQPLTCSAQSSSPPPPPASSPPPLSPSPLSSFSQPSTCPVKPDEDLPIPVQESQPLLSTPQPVSPLLDAQPQSTNHQTASAPISTTPIALPMHTPIPTKNPYMSPTPSSSSPSMPSLLSVSSLTQPTQESLPDQQSPTTLVVLDTHMQTQAQPDLLTTIQSQSPQDRDGMDTDSDYDDTIVPQQSHITQTKKFVGNSGLSNQREILPHSSHQPADRQAGCPISHLDSKELELSFKNNMGSCNESESEGSVPELEDPEGVPLRSLQSQSISPAEDGLNRPKQSRSEKKARKAMGKLGLRPVHGVTRITIRKSKSILFVISRPDVFKSPASDIYIVFGEAKIEDLSQQVHKAAAEKFKVPVEPSPMAPPAPPSLTIKEESEEEEVDDGGLEQRDIELVMAQANVSRSKAILALRHNTNDIVNAIMELTM